ncbi:MAG: CBS domain-containing protein [Spirochaetales bacterium]|nr:CBS domain-containing protein [Spirochaetales bacterium]
MRASELMTQRVVTLQPEDRVLDHLNVFKDNNIKHVPVVSTEKQVVGMVSEKDFENYVNIVKILQSREDPVLVRDIMTCPAFTLTDKIEIQDVAQAMIDNSIHAMVITDENGLLQGIVTSTDLLKHLANRDRYDRF